MAYREADRPQRQIEQGFEGKLKGLMDRLIQYGEQGEDIANYDATKKREPRIVFTKRFMDDAIFDLGVSLHKRFGNINYREWAHWMQCCYLEIWHDKILIKHCCEFFKDEAEKRFAKSIENLYQLPVQWCVSPQITESVFHGQLSTRN